jgi:periplasmic divalent cation tolerance protein
MTKTSRFLVVYATFPDIETAKKIVTGLIKNRLATCGNIFELTSLYVWKGKIESAYEYGALIKTTKALYKKVEAYIIKHHPYEVPEIIAWRIDRGSRDYLRWIDREVKGHQPRLGEI